MSDILYTLQCVGGYPPPPKKYNPSPGGIQAPSNSWFLGPPEFICQRASSSVQLFCRTHSCDQHTDTASNRPYLVLVMWPDNSAGNVQFLLCISTAKLRHIQRCLKTVCYICIVAKMTGHVIQFFKDYILSFTAQTE